MCSQNNKFTVVVSKLLDTDKTNELFNIQANSQTD